jgi:hypothetical protein
MEKPNDLNRPTGLYMKYLQRLHDQREQAGLPEPEEICGDDYWQQRRRDEELKREQNEGNN